VTYPANCPKCGAPIALKPDTLGFKCDYCHAVFFPGEEDDGVQISGEPDTSVACPICNQSLVKATIAKIAVLYCAQCHGLLMPMNVLPGLVDALKAGVDKAAVQTPPDPSELRRSIQCPKCHRRMDTHSYAGPGNVVIDSCGDCFLIWLDRGELMRIVHAPDEGDESESDW
jgi:Zn-finger nucleic acid-binding protein